MISILIPVYNGEKYIGACLDSIMKQSSNDYEVVIVDDGSTDKTYNICESYKNIGDIKLYSRPNKGVTFTRNELVKLANYDYFIFLDCDDILHYDTVKNLNNIINYNRCDTVLFDIKQFSQGFSFESIDCIEKYSTQKAINDFLTLERRGYIAGVLINKKKWNALQIEFELEKYVEDWFPMYFYVANSEDIYYIHANLYFYRQFDDSAISTSNLGVIKNYNRARLDIYRYTEKYLNIEKKYLCCFRVKTDLDILHEIFKIDKSKFYTLSSKFSCGYEKIFNVLKNKNLLLKEKIIYLFFKIRIYRVFKYFHNKI